jgi:hemerythrin-like domain-containing protein
MVNLKEVLKKDHVRLIGLLDKFLNTRSQNNLIIFLNNVERHLAIENEWIYKLGNIEELKDINLKILDDHRRFTKVFIKVRTTELFDLDMSILREIREPLMKHNDFEDLKFYPILEKKLSEEDKNELVDEVKEEVNFSVSD